MDIQNQSGQWAKSTQSRIEMFLDDYLIKSPIIKVRASSQRLLQSLFKKGNTQQKLRIFSLLENRCDQLVWMGKASENFLALVKKIFAMSSEYEDKKTRIINKIFTNLQTIHNAMVSNQAYEFYSFTSNLVDFGNQQFKPYLLEANGCLNCFGRQETKSQTFKLDQYLQTLKIFTNKLQYFFKRIYEVKDLNINLKQNTRAKSVTVSYVDENKQMVKIGKFKIRDSITLPFCKLQGLYFQFELPSSGIKRRAQQCIFCDGVDQMNCVCQACGRRNDTIEIGGSFKIIGADQELISNELCGDYQKIKESISCIKNLHRKIEKKQKITFSFRVDEMMEIYHRIVNNISLLHNKNLPILKAKQIQNCFSCNYYQALNIINFLKQVIKSSQNLNFSHQDVEKFKSILKQFLSKNKIESLKTHLLQAFSVFIVNFKKTSFKNELDGHTSHLADLISNILITSKQKRSSLQQIDDDLAEIKTFLSQNWNRFTTEQKIKLFVCYQVEWQILSLILANNFNHETDINRISLDRFEELKIFINFDMSQVFNLELTSFLKAFLKIVPLSILPATSLEIGDYQFLQYVDNKVPEIQKSKIEESIICCPNPMIKLDMFASLSVLISKLPVKESIKVMNSLFPYRSVWNLNIIKACTKFEEKLAELPAQQQINFCLYGYSKSKEFLYIQKLYKTLVPQRLNFIIRLEAPMNEIEINNIEYPYLPIRDVKSQDLQGDTIKALHSWVYAELVKLNQAMPLDIIVQKNIIDRMDFPIELVYQNIAENKSKRKIGDKQYDFFRVIYRIQGVLGQPKQRSIGNLRDQKLQTCISYASFLLNKFSDEFSKKIGLDVLIQILESIQAGPQNEDKKILLFEILSTISMNEAICKKIVQDQYGDSIINATVRLMSFVNEKDAKITNFLLQLSSKVIDEANQQMINLRKGSTGEYRKLSGMDIQAPSSESENKVSFVLQKIAQCQTTFDKTNNMLYRDISRKLIKLLPFCSKDQIQSSRLLFNFFDLTNWSSKSSAKMENIYIFVDSLSQSYMTFKSIANQNGVTNDIIKTIANSIRKQGQLQIDQKKLSLNRSTTESGLALLFALVQGDQRLQTQLFDSHIFHNIYQISQIPPKKAQEIHAGRVPENCYKMIKYFSEGKIVDDKIVKFLDEKKQIEKQKIIPTKNKKWENMKNKQKIALSKKMEDEAEEGDKDIITCLSCHQGYTKKKEVLGLYIYQTKNQIPIQANWWKDTQRMISFNSSTFFTAIHYECHVVAMETDKKMMRSQWDGALIRNMDVLCNSWIPFKGPITTFDEFSRVERKYFEKNKNGNYWNSMNDLSALIERLSIQFDFAAQSKGSSSSHNFRYIPILIGFCCHLIQRAGGCSIVQEGIKFLLQNPPKKLYYVNLLACYSLFTTNFETFQKLKQTLLTFITSLKTPDTSPEKQFHEIKASLIFLKIVEQIYEIIHKKIVETESQANVKFFKQLENQIVSCLNVIIPEFDLLNERYKSKYTKFVSIQEFGF